MDLKVGRVAAQSLKHGQELITAPHVAAQHADLATIAIPNSATVHATASTQQPNSAGVTHQQPPTEQGAEHAHAACMPESRLDARKRLVKVFMFATRCWAACWGLGEPVTTTVWRDAGACRSSWLRRMGTFWSLGKKAALAATEAP
jgi:hypothetical protein